MTMPINPQRLAGHIIPPTPGPANRASLQDGARDRFVGILWVNKARGKDTNSYLADYDSYELYDENKSYSKRPYMALHNGRMCEYNNYLCVLTSEESSTCIDEFYVVAKRLAGELEALEPYCTCITCCSSVCNPLKYLWCPSCTKCIKGGPGIASPQLIERAKQLRLAAETKEPYKWQRYISTKTLVHSAEVVLVLFVVVSATYFT